MPDRGCRASAVCVKRCHRAGNKPGILGKTSWLAAFLPCLAHANNELPRLDFLAADFEGEVLLESSFVNSLVGWDWFFDNGFRGGSTVIGNIEGGNIWFGHEAFLRPPGAPAAFTTWNNPAAGAANELDYHATTVGHVLAGSGYVDVDGGSYTLIGLGMAPEARVVSGAIATSFSTSDFGAFSVTEESLLAAYGAFFRGDGVSRPDVINSSWGGSGDPAAVSTASLTIDALASSQPDVTLVVAAGNGGNTPPGSPANGYNSLSVGATGGEGFLIPSSFSSRGLADFYNPVENGGTLHEGVRVAVDLAAPGEKFFLAAYLGDSGTIGAYAGLEELVSEPSPTDLYFRELDGTSYAAPVVAGGIALLKDVARAGLLETPESNPNAFDSRLMKSVLMAGSRATEGWDNGQNAFNVTTQALDAATGAGMLDLVGAAEVYLAATRDLFGVGGVVTTNGWDVGNVGLDGTVDYFMDADFEVSTQLTVALNWFALRGLDGNDLGIDLAFSDLDLEVWLLDGEGAFASQVAASRSRYQNTEFLRIEDLAPGRYGMRVLFGDMVYDTTGAVEEETYALAWRAVAIPEPGGPWLLALGLTVMLFRRKKSAATVISE